MGPEGPEQVLSRADLGPVIKPPPTAALAEQEASQVSPGATDRESITLAPDDPSNNGLSHPGEPEDEEVIVLEEPL